MLPVPVRAAHINGNEAVYAHGARGNPRTSMVITVSIVRRKIRRA